MEHLLSIADLSEQQIWALFELADKLKKEHKAKGNPPLLKGKSLGMVFQKPSLRTRVSFEMAMQHVGGYALYLAPTEIKLGQRESTADVARVLGRYVDGVMARVFAHQDILDLAEYSPVPIINGLSDYEHPCQALGDIFTLYERNPKLKGLKLSFIGDGNNVANSLAYTCAKLGINFTLAAPEGYELKPEVLAKAKEFAKAYNSEVIVTHDIDEAVKNADVLYTDVWASMGQEAERAERLKVFPPYQVNAALVAKAKPNVYVMHCLPAHRGEEITDEVADGSHSVLFDEAENRLHAQKAVLVELLGKYK